jgi:hypothetical protein
LTDLRTFMSQPESQNVGAAGVALCLVRESVFQSMKMRRMYRPLRGQVRSHYASHVVCGERRFVEANLFARRYSWRRRCAQDASDVTAHRGQASHQPMCLWEQSLLAIGCEAVAEAVNVRLRESRADFIASKLCSHKVERPALTRWNDPHTWCGRHLYNPQTHKSHPKVAFAGGSIR